MRFTTLLVTGALARGATARTAIAAPCLDSLVVEDTSGWKWRSAMQLRRPRRSIADGANGTTARLTTIGGGRGRA